MPVYPREERPILNIALPLLLWVPIVIATVYVAICFFGNFEFYHPLKYGAFLSL